MSEHDTTTSSGGASRSINEAEIEKLLSDKLMEGYILMETPCPVCSTPLVKNHSKGSNPNNKSIMKQPVTLSNDSFHKPFKPVDGVPICVVCRSHVVTHESDISILERCDSLKDRGSILLALYSSSSTTATSNGDDTGSKFTTDDSMPVVISVESHERDGEDNVVEVLPSPREGNVEKPIFVGDMEDEWVPVSEEEPERSSRLKTSFDDTTVQDPSVIQSKTDVNDVMEEYSVR
jgi:Sjogren's syndrome/scleroderma autoantigen 1 (Autoantigen p27)